jgi:SRSO17 transposase
MPDVHDALTTRSAHVHDALTTDTYLCNAPADTPLATLVRLSGMRWPIETCFEDGTQYLGMGDYEVRGWRGWHHHMTLCILAHFFLVRLCLR